MITTGDIYLKLLITDCQPQHDYGTCCYHVNVIYQLVMSTNLADYKQKKKRIQGLYLTRVMTNKLADAVSPLPAPAAVYQRCALVRPQPAWQAKVGSPLSDPILTPPY